MHGAGCRQTGRGKAFEASREGRREKLPAEVHASNDDGNAALTVLGIAVVVLLVVSGLTDIGIFFLARAKAQTAADAAALAAAAELIPGVGGDPEGEAKRFASANGARLVECDCRMGSRAAQVEVKAPAHFFMVFRAAKTEVPARARAGINLDALKGGPSSQP